jgi:N-acetyl-anhydromuramyl-L-alanine amidase AmpD
MEFYSSIKNLGIPIMTQQEFFSLYGNTYNDIDYIIRTSTNILTFKMAFKVPTIDNINDDETQKFTQSTLKLAQSLNIKCYGYFIGNVKMSDSAYSIFKKYKQQHFDKVQFSFCCDVDKNKLEQKIIRMLYLNHIYIYDSSGDCIMIDA